MGVEGPTKDEVADGAVAKAGRVRLSGRWKAALIIAAYCALLSFCFSTIHAILRESGGWRQFGTSLSTLGAPTVLIAAGCVAATYAVMCVIEQMVLRDMNARFPLASTIAAPLIANSVSIGVGFGAVSGAAIRYRVYGRHGMDAQTCVLIASGVTLVSLSGGGFLAALGLALQPDAIGPRIGASPDLLRLLGVLILAGAFALILAAGATHRPLKILGRAVRLPSTPAAFARLSAGAIDWLLSASVLFLLLPHGAQTNWLAFAAFFASLHFIAMATGAPAGIGVFDAAMLGLNPTAASSGQLAAALVVYRLLAFVTPLACGTIGLIYLESRRRLRPNPHHIAHIGPEPKPATLFAQRLIRRAIHLVSTHQLENHFARFNDDLKMTSTVGAVVETAQRALPSNLHTLTKGGPILVLAPHPDDEVLGCGGLLAACAAAGVKAHIAILTDGALSHPGSQAWSARRLAAQRALEARKAARLLGVPEKRLHFMNQRDGRLLLEGAKRNHATEALARLARREKIRRVFVSWRHDPHPDHLAAAMIAEQLRKRLPHIDVLEYPIWGLLLPKDVAIKDGPWTALRFDVADHLPLKRRALLCYRTQTTAMIGDTPFAMRLQVDQLDALMTRNEVFLHRRL